MWVREFKLSMGFCRLVGMSLCGLVYVCAYE